MKTVNKKLKDYVIINPKEVIAPNKFAKKVAMEKLQPFCRDIVEYELCEYKGGTKFRNGDTIMARITPCLENGKTAKVNFLDNGEVGFGSTEYIVFRAKEEIMDADFLYYLIISPLVRETAIKSMVGSSGRQRVQTDVVANIEIEIPSLLEQKKVANIMKVLDDKIALNQKINKNLEEQAQAIFKAWFEDYEPFGGEAPNEFISMTLGRVAEIKTDSMSPSKNPNVEVEHYSIPAYDEKHFPVFETTDDIKSNKYIITDKSVIISKLNPDTKRIWRPMCLSEHPICSTEFIVYEARNPAHKDFLYSLIDSVRFYNYLCSHTTGSTNSRQRATPSATLDFEFLLPSDEWIKKFCLIVTPIYDMISANLMENQALANLRDALLPRLMSGEIDVSEMEV